MAYYRDPHGQPRSIRELVQRVGRASNGPGANQHDCAVGMQQPSVPAAPSNSPAIQCGSVQEEMGTRFQQCRGTATSALTRPIARRRFMPYSRQRSSVPRTRAMPLNVQGRTFTRTVFLLHQQESLIPRGLQRQNMYDEGRVVDFVELNTSWCSDTIHACIEDLFGSVLSIATDTASPR